MKYDTVIFDLDGTLLYTLCGLRDSLNHALRTFGYPERTTEETRRFVGNGVRRLVARGLPGGMENPEFEEVFAAFSAHYALHGSDDTLPYEGIIPMLNTLRARGVRLGVVTNKGHSDAVPMIEHFFGGRIDITVGKKEGREVKPDPAGVREVLEILGATAEKSVYVGDSDVDYYTAQNAGLACVLVDWGYRDKEELENLGALALIHHPAELPEILEE